MLYKDKYRVETARLQGWDYATPGWYFVTICTRDSACTLGQVSAGKVALTPAGLIAQQCLYHICKITPHIQLDALVVMPNHVHAIIVLEAQATAQTTAQPSRVADSTETRMALISPRAGSLPAIIRSYKAAVSRRCANRGIAGLVWQERYYDHIIRNDGELDRIRTYVANNPAQWEQDKLYAPW